MVHETECIPVIVVVNGPVGTWITIVEWFWWILSFRVHWNMYIGLRGLDVQGRRVIRSGVAEVTGIRIPGCRGVPDLRPSITRAYASQSIFLLMRLPVKSILRVLLATQGTAVHGVQEFFAYV